jgi:transmembrane sensor
MVPRESAAVIEEAASAWVVQLDRGLSSSEQAALDAWVSADARHLGALARAQALWLEADRTQIYRSARTAGAKGHLALKWRAPLRWAWAASVVMLVGSAIYGWQSYAATHISTDIGEIRHIPLADGSSVTLNTHSRVSVEYSKGTRTVRLDRGEALFDVAHDVTRPFIVEAGMVRVRAIGTEFVVRRNGQSDAQVTVARGTVDVWREIATPEPSVRLSTGLRTNATPVAVQIPQQLSESEVARSIAWQDGILDLDGRTLGEAAAEFNRYNRETVVISDPSLAGRKVVGRFHTSDPKGFAAAAAAMLDAHVSTESDHIVLERQHKP